MNWFDKYLVFRFKYIALGLILFWFITVGEQGFMYTKINFKYREGVVVKKKEEPNMQITNWSYWNHKNTKKISICEVF